MRISFQSRSNVQCWCPLTHFHFISFNFNSGHIYSREAIVSYLLTKSQQLKEQKTQYEALLAADAQTLHHKQKSNQTLAIQTFIEKDQGPAQQSQQNHSTVFHQSLKRKIDIETKAEGNKRLKEISYWLSEAQPEYNGKEQTIRENPPSKRPSSPMSGNPLRLKDLIPITLHREGTGLNSKGDPDGKCICAVSNKAITTQPVLVLQKTGVVILKQVYDAVVKTKDGKKLVCPITGTKFKEKDVLELQKGKSGFAASGEVIASKYTPTLTWKPWREESCHGMSRRWS